MKCTEIVVFATRVKLCNHIYDVRTSANSFPIFHRHACWWLVLCKIHNQYLLIIFDNTVFQNGIFIFQIVIRLNHYERIEQEQHKGKINICICYVMHQHIEQRFNIYESQS